MTTSTTGVPVDLEPRLLGQTVGRDRRQRGESGSRPPVRSTRGRRGHPRRPQSGAVERRRAGWARSTAAFDAANPASLQSFFRDLPTPIDHLLVTGGGPHYGPPLEMTPEEAQRGLSESSVLALQVAQQHRQGQTRRRCCSWAAPAAAGRPRLGDRLLRHRGPAGAHRQPRARARADPGQPHRARLRRHAALGVAPRRRPGGTARRAPRVAADRPRRPADVAALEHLMINAVSPARRP